MHTDWSQFFGRFHPLIVHVPIGIILFTAILNIIAVYRKNVFLAAAIDIGLLAGAISAGLAAISGFFLSADGGYNNNTLSWHKWIGITAAILTFTAWLIRTSKKADIVFFRINSSSWLLSASIVLIAVGGHLGGTMTHGEGYLTKYMPGFLKPVLGVTKRPPPRKTIPVLDSVIVFKDIIQPVFDTKCIGCHNPGKNKGELDLTTIEGILKGGKSGSIITAGDIEKSELIRRVTLSPQSTKFMPADNQPPLTAIEINFLKWWVQSGADHKKNITVSGVDEKTKYLIAAYLGIHAEDDKEIKLPETTAADPAVLRQLKEMNVVIRPLSSKNNLLEASLVMLQQADPAQLLAIIKKIAEVKDQLYRLDAANCSLSNEAVKIIAGFTRLNKLEIQKNNLTDDAVLPLRALRQLEILNAGQNGLTDKCIAVFGELTSLKKINLWQTKVTAQGVKDLQLRLRDLQVDH